MAQLLWKHILEVPFATGDEGELVDVLRQVFFHELCEPWPNLFERRCLIDGLLLNPGEFRAEVGQLRLENGANVFVKRVFNGAGSYVVKQHRELDDLDHGSATLQRGCLHHFEGSPLVSLHPRLELWCLRMLPRSPRCLGTLHDCWPCGGGPVATRIARK